MPQISFTCATETGDKIAQLTLGDDTLVSNVKPLIESQIGIPASEQGLSSSNKSLSDSQTLAQSGVKDGDVLLVKREKREYTSFDQIPPHILNDVKLFQEAVRGSPRLLQQLMLNNPTMAEAVLAEGTFLLEAYFAEQRRARQQQQMQQAQRVQQLNADPFDIEAQKKIEEEIRMKNVNTNYEATIENMPEAFARVCMLYVPAELNGHQITAFVDSGAQSTIMSESCARRVDLMRLIDTRFSGMAKGVGTARIIGRVHSALIKIGKHVLNCSVTVLEGDSMDFLFGLDMLKRHQICIDLRKNCLTIEDEDVHFLAEKDIPSIDDPRTAITSPRASPAPPERKEFEPSSSSSSSNARGTSSATSSSSSSSSAVNQAPSGSSSSSAVSQPAPVRTQAAGSSFPESSILALVNNMGVSRQQAVQALAATGGNVDMAASLLFGGF